MDLLPITKQSIFTTCDKKNWLKIYDLTL